MNEHATNACGDNDSRLFSAKTTNIKHYIETYTGTTIELLVANEVVSRKLNKPITYKQASIIKNAVYEYLEKEVIEKVEQAEQGFYDFDYDKLCFTVENSINVQIKQYLPNSSSDSDLNIYDAALKILGEGSDTCM